MTPTAALIERLVPTRRHGTMRAREWLDEHGLPTSRDEAWRYTPVEEIVARLAVAAPALATATTLSRSVVDDLAGDHGGPRLVFVNGTHVPELSDDRIDVGGVSFGPLTGPAWVDAARLVDGFQALNRAAAATPAVVVVEQDVHVHDPIHVVHVAVPGEGVTVCHPHTIVDARPGSHFSVLETFCGFDGPMLTNASTTIRAGESASVTHYRVQADPPASLHVGHTSVTQAQGSEVRITSVMLGAAIARSAIDVVLEGQGATSELDGLYLPAGHQRHDNVVTVDHAASRCRSTQLFKGVVDDHARGSFSGRIVVRPDTVGTDASQLNRNLVLQATAQADTRPWLEILADDVRCTHGASVGRLDEEAFFYLRSRGIPVALARSMLVDAFAAEITDRIALPSLRDHLSALARFRREAGS